MASREPESVGTSLNEVHTEAIYSLRSNEFPFIIMALDGSTGLGAVRLVQAGRRLATGVPYCSSCHPESPHIDDHVGNEADECRTDIRQ